MKSCCRFYSENSLGIRQWRHFLLGFRVVGFSLTKVTQFYHTPNMSKGKKLLQQNTVVHVCKLAHFCKVGTLMIYRNRTRFA